MADFRLHTHKFELQLLANNFAFKSFGTTASGGDETGTTFPGQCMLGRNLLYLMSAQHQWPLEGLDLATAFLQTLPTEADKELWTTNWRRKVARGHGCGTRTDPSNLAQHLWFHYSS